MRVELLFLSFCIGSCLFIQEIFAATWWEMSPIEVREKINQRIMEIEAPLPQVREIKNQTVHFPGRDTSIRVYTPNHHQKLPIILFIHGGAWVGGNLNTHDQLARYLCSQAEAIVVSVDYLNSPEGKFPLPLQQCFDVLLWIKEHISGNEAKLAVVGDSAGGNMAAALCLMARDCLGPTIDLQVLINPVLDLTCKGTLDRQNDDLDPLRWQALQYLSTPDDAAHSYVSPLLAEDLSHLPEAVILLAERDDLRESGKKYAKRLLSSGVSTFVYCQQGVGHLAGHAARASSQARETLDVAVMSLKKTFSSTTHSSLRDEPFFQASHEHPYHLSIGSVLFDQNGLVACHHFKQIFGYEDIYILMRESMENDETPLMTLSRGLKEEFGAIAEPIAFLGCLSGFLPDSKLSFEKTTLYIACRLISWNPENRDPDDPEASSTIEWIEPERLITLMQLQGVRFQNRIDADESEVIRRALPHLMKAKQCASRMLNLDS